MPINSAGLSREYEMKQGNKLKPLGALIAGFAIYSDPSLAADKNESKDGGTLPAVVVTAKKEEASYSATKTRVGKVEQDPHDIPQAITTLTSKLLQEQQVGSLQEAMRNVSGISFNAAEGGRAGDNMNLRGFYTFGDMYLDGIRDTAQYNRETFNYEQIDVLRGAGAMLFGRGQAGGVINQVSKTPLDVDQYKLSGSLGSYGYQQQTADLNKSISEDIGLRINLMNRSEGSWRSNPATGAEPEIHRSGAAISLALNQSNHHKIWLNHYYLRTRDNPDYGVSFNTATRLPGTLLPASTFFGTRITFDNSDTSMSTAVHEWKIDKDTQLRTQLRFADYDRSYWAKTPNVSTAPNAVGGVGGNQTRMAYYNTTTLQSDFSKKFQAMGMQHQLLSGIEYLKEESSRKTLFNFGNLSNPDFRSFQGANVNATAFDGNSYAVYAQDTVEFIPKWKATMGARRDELNAKYSNATSPKLQFGEWSYRSALSYHATDESHYYVAWSDSFSPTADLYQLTVTPQPPERSDTIELGAKYILFDGDLTLRAALYRATKYWERNTDLEATASILTNKRRTDGIELEAAGRINKNWEVFAGLSIMDARILEVAQNINPTTGAITTGNAAYIGQRARNTPRYTMNLWTTYKLDEHWKLGGGVEAKGDRQAFNPSSSAATPTLNGGYHPNTAPAYARVDAIASYEQAKWALKLNVKNVLDKLYYDGLYDNGSFTVPGVRRTFILTAELKY